MANICEFELKAVGSRGSIYNLEKFLTIGKYADEFYINEVPKELALLGLGKKESQLLAYYIETGQDSELNDCIKTMYSKETQELIIGVLSYLIKRRKLYSKNVSYARSYVEPDEICIDRISLHEHSLHVRSWCRWSFYSAFADGDRKFDMKYWEPRADLLQDFVKIQGSLRIEVMTIEEDSFTERLEFENGKGITLIESDSYEKKEVKHEDGFIEYVPQANKHIYEGGLEFKW